MIFGEIATKDAVGAYLAHSVKVAGIRFKKGRFLDEGSISTLLANDVETVIVAFLADDDVHEQDAAHRVGQAVGGTGVRVELPFTGRVNLFAEHDGLLVANERLVNSLNNMHPAVTIATLANFERVEKGRMIGTVKVIPFAAPEPAVSAAEALGEMVRVHPFKLKSVVLVATRLSSLKEATMDKTRAVLSDRLALAGAQLVLETRVDHTREAITSGLAQVLDAQPELIILFGASATVDERDVGPAGLISAGGRLHHFGMPVDPGNLLFLGDLEGIPVIGAPGCARSPAENGFDWILNRLLADITVTRNDIMGLGVGGLLMEINSRPQPRQAVLETTQKISAVVLAAGRSTRMGGPNKLLARLNGETLLRRVVLSLGSSRVDEIIVVTGHMATQIEQELADLDVRIVHNPDFAEGLSTSLRAGISALNDDVDAALVALGDMPFVDANAFERVINAYLEDDEVLGVVATSYGKRGNPVLWSRRFFPDLMQIHGDTGARHLIGENEAVIVEVEIGEGAALDLDTPEALRDAGGEI